MLKVKFILKHTLTPVAKCAFHFIAWTFLEHQMPSKVANTSNREGACCLLLLLNWKNAFIKDIHTYIYILAHIGGLGKEETSHH